MQIRICADVTCEWRNAERERRRWQAGWIREWRRGQERRRMENGEWRERAREGKCLPFCTALKRDIVPAVPLRMPASKPPLGRRLH